MLKYFFDLDGVTVNYDREAYIGEQPRYLIPGEHYFRNLEPDRTILKLIDELHKESRYTGDEIYFLTSIHMSPVFNEHFHDKITWIMKWFPYTVIDNILISTGSKRDTVEFIQNCTLDANHILIDDYNKNLLEWRSAGGRAIKYCNGINNPDSFDGLKLYRDQPVTNDLVLKSLRY